jgi:hypothetical protein
VDRGAPHTLGQDDAIAEDDERRAGVHGSL